MDAGSSASHFFYCSRVLRYNIINSFQLDFFLLTKRFRQEIKGILVLWTSLVQVNGIDKLNGSYFYILFTGIGLL